MCVAYRPPDTKLCEFSALLKCVDDTLTSLPSPAPTVVLMADFNFGHRTIKWIQSEDGFLVPIVAGHNEEETTCTETCRLG